MRDLQPRYASKATTASPPFLELREESSVAFEPAELRPPGLRLVSALADESGAASEFLKSRYALSVPRTENLSATIGIGGLGVREFAAPRLSVSEDFQQIAGYEVTVSRVRELLSEPETDEYGISRPTPYAYHRALQLLEGASRQARHPIPRGSASTDSEGGIRVTWTRTNRELRLVVASSVERDSYIYYEAGDSYGVEAVSSSKDLARWVEWLVAER